MKSVCLFLMILLIPVLSFSQKKDLKKSTGRLNDFMNSHIPKSASSIKGYHLTVNDSTLDKETLLKNGDSYLQKYKLTDAIIETVYVNIEGFEDFNSGYSEYWDVFIDEKWILNGVLRKEEAEELVLLLKKVQLDYSKELK